MLLKRFQKYANDEGLRLVSHGSLKAALAARSRRRPRQSRQRLRPSSFAEGKTRGLFPIYYCNVRPQLPLTSAWSRHDPRESANIRERSKAAAQTERNDRREVISTFALISDIFPRGWRGPGVQGMKPGVFPRPFRFFFLEILRTEGLRRKKISTRLN